MAEIDKIAVNAVEKALSMGASYADSRFVEIEDESLSYSDGSPESVNRCVRISGCWLIKWRIFIGKM